LLVEVVCSFAENSSSWPVVVVQLNLETRLIMR
jgi:hypothetical protein